jgi:hypothetical protein
MPDSTSHSFFTRHEFISFLLGFLKLFSSGGHFYNHLSDVTFGRQLGAPDSQPVDDPATDAHSRR